jgi:outer membrane protein OmpA-like peptidoglycan-associated protein
MTRSLLNLLMLLSMWAYGLGATLPPGSPPAAGTAQMLPPDTPRKEAPPQDSARKRSRPASERHPRAVRPASAPGAAPAVPAPAAPQPPAQITEEESERRRAIADSVERAQAEARAKRLAEEEARRKAEEARKAQEQARLKAEAERKAQEEAARLQAARDRRRYSQDSLQAVLDSLERFEAEERIRLREERRAAGITGPIPYADSLIARAQPRILVAVGENPGGMYSSTGPLGVYLPYADPDRDSIPNLYDKCPADPGIAENRGCPAGDPRGFPQSARPPGRQGFDAWERIYFTANSAYLSGQSRIILNRAVQFLRENPGRNLLLAGHCAPGESATLAQGRCQAAYDYLLARGVPEKRIRWESFGSQVRLSAEEAARRRVELIVEEN